MSARRLAAIVAMLGAGAAQAENMHEFRPEFDAYVPPNSRARILLLATTTQPDQEGCSGILLDPAVDGTVGVHLDHSITPTMRKAPADQDWERNRYLWVRVGYQHARSLGDDTESNAFRENRGVFEINGRTPPTVGAVEVFSRLRMDLRDRNGERSRLYRIRLGLERPFRFRGHPVTPYVTAGTIYDTRCDEWKQQRYQLGAEVRLSAAWRIDPYIETRDDQRSEPARVYAVGLAFKYFR